VNPLIRLHNTLTRTKEPLRTERPDRVTMYVCGPTVYDYAHIGNARPAVVFDVLSRLLRRGYPQVIYARNFTDVDDKINAAAATAGVSIGTITDRYINVYHEDMRALGVLTPDLEPRVTEHIPAIIELIGKLIARGHAYIEQEHVLFHVPSYPAYGQLSGRRTEGMLAGARVEVAPYKRDPMDFVLWKPSTPGLPGWVHNSFVTVDGQKMSKSLSNVLQVRDLLDIAPGEAIRLALLSTHYRRPLDWNSQRLLAVRQTLTRYYESLSKVAHIAAPPQVEPDPVFLESLQNDLNIPGALARLRVLLTQLDDADTDARRAHAKSVLLPSSGLLGLLQQAPQAALAALRPAASMPSAQSSEGIRIETLVAKREQARRDRDFATADALREELEAAGFIIKDTPEGPVLRPAVNEPA